MNNISLGNKEVIHFVGIGGIGMSGLAQIMKIMGFQVQGSDLTKNKNTETHPGNYGNPNGTICFDFPLFGPLWVEANSMSNEKSFQNMARTGPDEPI